MRPFLEPSRGSGLWQVLRVMLQDLRYGLRVLVEEPGLHRRRGALAGARHRRQHRHLQPDQRAAAATDAGRGSARLVLGLHDRSAESRQPAALAPQLQGPARSEPGLHRHGGVHVRPGELEPRQQRLRTGACPGRQPATTSRCSARGAVLGRGVRAGRGCQGDARRRRQPWLLGAQPRHATPPSSADADASTGSRSRSSASRRKDSPARCWAAVRPSGCRCRCTRVAQPGFDWYEQRRGLFLFAFGTAEARRGAGPGLCEHAGHLRAARTGVSDGQQGAERRQRCRCSMRD